MADVILKDASGNDVKYSGVTVIDVPVASTAGEMVTNRFTALINAKVYIVKRANSVDGSAYWEVLGKLQYIPTNDCIQFSLTDSEYQSYGGDGVVCFVTTKSLTVGETYASTDMY